MKNGVNPLKKEDYEQYFIKIPWNLVFGKKKKKFLCSELEKMHPCFSEDCCFDSKIHFRKKEFCADVVVMDKIKLADYRYRFAGKKIALEENGKRFVFCERKINVFVFFAVFLGLAASVITGIVINRNGRDEKIAAEKSECDENNLFENENDENVLNAGEFCKVLSDLIFQKGEITSFEWDTDGYFENVKFSLRNIYPEDFGDFRESVSFSSLTYEGTVPLLNVQGKQKIKLNRDKEKKYLAEDFCLDLQKIRMCIFEFKGKILEENDENLSFKLQFDEFVEKDGNNFYEILNKVLEQNEIGLEKLKLNFTKENESRSVGIYLKMNEKLFCVDCDVLKAAGEIVKKKTVSAPKYADIGNRKNNSTGFYSENDFHSENGGKNQMNENGKNDSRKSEFDDVSKKIGQIIHDDGSVNVFYLDKNKKIVEIVGNNLEE